MSCFATISSGSPDFLTPVPITPIVPPDGIRGSFHTDPRLDPAFVQPEMPPTVQQPTGTIDFCFAHAFSEPIEAWVVEADQFQARINLQICGWRKAGQPVDVTVTYPDGTQETLTVETETTRLGGDDERFVYASHSFEVSPSMNMGRYAFTFEGVGESGEVGVFSAETIVTLPTEPRIYSLSLPSGTAWLYGFIPDETVQLFRYDVSERDYIEWEGFGGITETYSLVDLQTVTVTQDGTATLTNFAPAESRRYGFSAQIIAIGSVSGEISMPFPMRVEKSILLEQDQ